MTSYPPKWNNSLFSTALFPLLFLLLDSVNVDYRGLESTFGVPKSSPGPPEKGSTKCHLGLRKCQAVGLAFSIYTPRGIRRLRAPHSFTPALRAAPKGCRRKTSGPSPVGFASEVDLFQDKTLLEREDPCYCLSGI